MYLPSLSLLTLRLSPSLRCWGRRRSARSCRQQRQQSLIQRRRWSLTMGCCLMSFRVSRTSRRWRFCPETASRRYDQSFIPKHDSCCGYIDVLTHVKSVFAAGEVGADHSVRRGAGSAQRRAGTHQGRFLPGGVWRRGGGREERYPKNTPWKKNTAQTDVTPERIDYTFVFPDEDGSEFERELTEALEGLSVSATAEKLSKVLTPHFCVLDQIPVLS